MSAAVLLKKDIEEIATELIEQHEEEILEDAIKDIDPKDVFRDPIDSKCITCEDDGTFVKSSWEDPIVEFLWAKDNLPPV